MDGASALQQRGHIDLTGSPSEPVVAPSLSRDASGRSSVEARSWLTSVAPFLTISSRCVGARRAGVPRGAAAQEPRNPARAVGDRPRRVPRSAAPRTTDQRQLASCDRMRRMVAARSDDRTGSTGW